jgi:branched-chain amino acid transport system substrate-binding protein
LWSSSAAAQDTIKIGLILPYSGQFADMATQADNGIKLYMTKHGDTVAGKKIVVIRKDVGGIAPDLAKRLAQELVVRDGVDILAGFIATPNALAASDVSDQAKKFMVIVNAGTSIVTTKSRYSVRTSFTIAQVADSIGKWAAKNGIKKTYTMVSDYAPGHDAETLFGQAFKASGGEIVGSVKIPVSNPDFSPFVQRMKDANPDSVFVFVPGGAQPAAFGKAIFERGIDPHRTRIMGTGEITDEIALKSMGDAALGIVSAWHYDYSLSSATNDAFVKAYRAEFKRTPDFVAVGGYDGMRVIYEALKKTKGSGDGDALIGATKGMAWESPRGPISIDPATRNIVQTIYIREVRKVDGSYRNVVIDKIADVKDTVLDSMKK